MEDNSGDETGDGCARLKRECAAMVEYLKELENKESELTIGNEILARECMCNGWTPGLQDPKPPVKKRRATSTKGKSTANKED